MKADSQGIIFESIIENIGLEDGKYKPIIIHDENRIKQVLLNL